MPIRYLIVGVFNHILLYIALVRLCESAGETNLLASERISKFRSDDKAQGDQVFV